MPATAAARARRPGVLQVAGEVLVTAGVLVLLFLAWQVWVDSWITGAAQQRAAAAQAKEFLEAAPSSARDAHGAMATPAATAPAATDSASSGRAAGGGSPDAATVVPVARPVATSSPFAVMYVPRFGSGWKRIIREGVDARTVLDSWTAGVGHYPGTAMPGAVGNVAIAAHDTGYGDTFLGLSTLRLDDPIYLQTADGWYTYRFRDMEYVQPDAVDVLLPVPRVAGAAPADRILTMTTCNPPYHGVERIIAYSTFAGFRPASAGPPAAIAGEVAALGAG